MGAKGLFVTFTSINCVIGIFFKCCTEGISPQSILTGCQIVHCQSRTLELFQRQIKTHINRLKLNIDKTKQCAKFWHKLCCLYHLKGNVEKILRYSGAHIIIRDFLNLSAWISSWTVLKWTRGSIAKCVHSLLNSLDPRLPNPLIHLLIAWAHCVLTKVSVYNCWQSFIVEEAPKE